MARSLHLNAFLMASGHHSAAWRMPESDPLADWDVAHWMRLAQIAERGKLDSVFVADWPSLNIPSIEFGPDGQLDAVVILSAVAAVTERIGLIASATTTFDSPYNVARRFASFDHVSRGRAGWNIVTSPDLNTAALFGLEDRPLHADRYKRATEFVEVVLKLWSGWDEDAVLGDKESGQYADLSRIHEVNHRGAYYNVRGSLNVARSPQGRPLLVQAGSSEDGKDFAARYAEAVYTAQQTPSSGKAFYADLKGRAVRAGRDPDTISILPGLMPILGSTEAEAKERAEQLDGYIVPDAGLGRLEHVLEVPTEGFELDQELPAEVTAATAKEGSSSRAELVVDMARKEHLTVRQLISRLSARGHLTAVGTPEQIADLIQTWYEERASDGFNVLPPVVPSSLEEFVDQVVPILQRRGLFRTEYPAGDLRAIYGSAG